jgi:putative endonuclease
MPGGWVYIMTNPPQWNALYRRDQRYCAQGVRAPGGTNQGVHQRFGLRRLVFMEFYESITDAIQREHNIKHWPRAWKARVILDANPDWRDLYEDLNK